MAIFDHKLWILFHGDGFSGYSDGTDCPHVPLAGLELPKKSAIVLRQLGHVIYKPLHAIAKGRRELDHLL